MLVHKDSCVSTARIQICDVLWTAGAQKALEFFLITTEEPHKVTDKLRHNSTGSVPTWSGQVSELTCPVSTATLMMEPKFQGTLLDIATFLGFISFQSHFPILLVLFICEHLLFILLSQEPLVQVLLLRNPN